MGNVLVGGDVCEGCLYGWGDCAWVGMCVYMGKGVWLRDVWLGEWVDGGCVGGWRMCGWVEDVWVGRGYVGG